jgi:hypothetical protein
VRGDEVGEARDQPEAREACRRRQDDGLDTLGVPDLARRPVEADERIDDRELQRAAVVGEGERTVQAAEQRDAETRFERLDLAADRRLGQRDLVGRRA